MTPGYGFKERIARLGLRQESVAEEAGFESTLFSRFVNGRREPPPDFEARVTAAIDTLERAEKAAQEARQRVLAGGAA